MNSPIDVRTPSIPATSGARPPVSPAEPAVPGSSRLPFAVEQDASLHDPAEVFEAGLLQHHLATTAYPIAHRRTIWGYRVADPDLYPGLLAGAVNASEGLCLYAHVPFCERRCTFCEYCVVKEHDEAHEARYMAAMERELDRAADMLGRGTPPLVGFDIGGGTPSLVQPARIERLVSRVLARFATAPGFQISIETTPRLAALRPERLAALRRMGIERISMGLQTDNPALLRRYGRDINLVSHNRVGVQNIRAAGFERFNIDLMYGFASQSVEDLLASLRSTIALGPEYITLYRMRYKGTRVHDEAAAVHRATVSAMYAEARELLQGAGFEGAPGKNTFSRRPGESGASAYLTARVVRSVPYLGLGLGAQSFTNNVLAYNLGAADKRLDAYLKAVDAGEPPVQDLYHLPLSEGMAKMISVSFYFGAVDLAAFEARFGVRLERRFAAEVAFLQERGLARLDTDALRMTCAGAADFSGVLALFYSPRVKDHLLSLSADPERRAV